MNGGVRQATRRKACDACTGESVVVAAHNIARFTIGAH